MSIEVLPLDLGVFLRSGRLRTECGLLVNDSLAAATALERNVTAIARPIRISRGSKSWTGTVPLISDSFALGLQRSKAPPQRLVELDVSVGDALLLLIR